MIDWEKYNRSQAAITGLGFVEVDIKDYEKMSAAFKQCDELAKAMKHLIEGASRLSVALDCYEDGLTTSKKILRWDIIGNAMNILDSLEENKNK